MVASDAARYGTDWTADEIAVCVAEYFLMLAQEQAGRPYVKADHWRRVMGQTGRRKGSVEFKFGNISAVLEELSVPWVWGHKPAHNYQNALVEAVERQLIDHAGFFEPSAAFTPSSGQFAEGLFVDPPKLKAKEPADIIPAMRQLIRKFDPAARDYRNRMLGKAGEKFVLDYERDNLERAGCSKLAGKVRWVSNEDGDGYGYDILSFTPKGEERLLEIKTTCGHARTPFWITRRECEVATKHQKIFRIRRVFHFCNKPQMFELPPPLDEQVSLTATCYLASFRS